MQGVELPCDWTVNRRPTNAPPANTTTTAHVATKPRTKHEAPEQSTIAKPDPPLLPSEGSGEPMVVVATNPLGPRTQLKAAPTPKRDTLASMLPNHGQVRKLVLQHLNTTETDTSVAPLDIVVDNLLSRLPYKKMLCDMFGGTLRGNLQTSQIPYVTRAYEEAFMREVQHAGERECARGQQCECMFIDRQQPFVGVEFLLPSEERPPTPHLCVLCCRAITQQLYYDVMFDKADFPGISLLLILLHFFGKGA
jgi:hypothetical protein